MNFARRLALAAILLASSVPVVADEAADIFNKLYGDDVKRVAATPAPKPSPAILVLDLGKGVMMKLVLIRPGKFMMGSADSDKDRRAQDGPQHEVTISKPFYMGVTEVTQIQYVAVMGTNPSRVTGPANPVDGITWDEAAEFCRRLSEKTRKTVRLPTEAEWEYACRAGSKTQYSFGDSDAILGNYAWWGENSDTKTHPVGQKRPNAWGLYDMHGNVSEWCQDLYGAYPGGDQEAAKKYQLEGARVLRGGSYLSNIRSFLSCAWRRCFPPAGRNIFNEEGFRCAVTP